MRSDNEGQLVGTESLVLDRGESRLVDVLPRLPREVAVVAEPHLQRVEQALHVVGEAALWLKDVLHEVELATLWW